MNKGSGQEGRLRDSFLIATPNDTVFDGESEKKMVQCLRACGTRVVLLTWQHGPFTHAIEGPGGALADEWDSFSQHCREEEFLTVAELQRAAGGDGRCPGEYN